MSTQQVIFQYLSAGSHTLTVPDGFSNQVLVYAWGAGGADSQAGVAGGGGGFAQGIVTGSSGDTVIISVGSTGSPDGIGGDGSNPVISLSGGSSGSVTSNDWDGKSGPGAGGGAATTVLVNSIPMLVAAGGGGAGGGFDYQIGSIGLAGGVATLTSPTPRGGISPDGYAVGGAGGGGYPYGGAGGTSAGDDAGGGAGGYGGQNYANASVTSSTLTAGSGVVPGGSTNALYPRAKRGYNGYDGAVIIIFTKSFRAWIKDTTWKEANNAWVKADNAWKQITRAWVKADDEWKPIQSGVSLVPIRVESVPATPVTINITIAASTNNYVLSDFLSATSYYPGRSIVNLTVNAGVIVSSSSAGTPALIVNGLTVGDTITLTNNGTIQGRGGNGGAAGSYSSVTSGGSPATSNSCFLPGTLVSTPDGYVTIETIQVGDLVYAYNINSEFNNSAVLEPKTVTKTYEHTWEEANKVTPLLIITHSQGELIVTPEHELLCLDKVDPNSDYPGFVRADALAVGDIIYAEDGSELTITDIANGPEHYEYVYNIEVDDYHTYVANGIRVHNGTQAPRGNYSVGTTVITSNPGQPGAAGGIALEVQYTTTLVNNSIIAGGGGGGGGGGGTTGGQGGGGAGYGSGANNGTVSAGGAGTGYGGAGGARGVSGTSGTNDTNNGGVGGDPGAAIKGITNVTINTAGTITGPRIV